MQYNCKQHRLLYVQTSRLTTTLNREQCVDLTQLGFNLVFVDLVLQEQLSFAEAKNKELSMHVDLLNSSLRVSAGGICSRTN